MDQFTLYTHVEELVKPYNPHYLFYQLTPL